ncbi:hypothetical protein F2Q70_00036964 [Brassica cretica]|uniref:Uncharacterized protein n=1 Tax=Brassica cretica TaxID=69181 RepID=A0A8S9JUE7_BRACR|nr:hypothetical protein F2Q70_00036964 [Brassica cretica]
MISPRLSVSLLDDSAMNLLASRGVDLLEDENPPSLSRRLTAMKNHFTPLSGSELSSTKSKERWTEQETKLSTMISPRLSVSLLDDSSMNLLASRGVDLLEDENPPSLSRLLTAMKNHFTPLSGPELTSMKSKERWTEQETKVRQTRRLQ